MEVFQSKALIRDGNAKGNLPCTCSGQPRLAVLPRDVAAHTVASYCSAESSAV